MWLRIDNRLIHGQVIEGWLPFVGSTHLIVASDELAEDFLRQQIMTLAVPGDVEVSFVPLAELKSALGEYGDDSFVLFENCADARRAAELGTDIMVLNIGNIHYAEGRKQILPHVSLSEQDIADLRYLRDERNTKLDFRAVPTQSVKVPDGQLL